ncbi:RHS repeat-associated core domain-containing protein [uncultured Desulfuromusa sp.]|uniref:RHS repeat domain-containing protein n=1 Tax=uncultured Desulfuromusa sp. TaxID=219183 RepID=UPI002AA75475|nr:RHS repeat-associated core domain-containing protein [uncultured Desulfuromusa sp.]
MVTVLRGKVEIKQVGSNRNAAVCLISDNSNLLTWDNGSISGTLVYGELNRKTQETINYGPFSKSTSYSYDWRGNKNTYTDAEGILHSYEYLKNNRLSKISFDGQAIDLMIDKTRISKINYGNGTNSDYGYNENGWLSRIDTQNGTTIIQARDYQFDPSGNINQIGALAGTTSYGYDDLYQLTSADHPDSSGLADEAYSYDQVGNRLTSSTTPGSWSHNQNNELLDSSAATYTYDSNGNTTQKTEGGQITRYQYNSRNRLSRVILADGRVADYSYDPFGRRIKKQVGSIITWYLYADEGVIGEYSNTGSWQKSYGWQPNSLWGTDPLYMRDSTGLYYYHNDHLGTPQRLTNATTGEIVWSANYAAFGKATIDPLSTVENNLRFPGQYYDQETDLHYNWHRTYDPGTGRYTQVDPIGLMGGINFFDYTGDDPINYIDEMGLFRFSKAALSGTPPGSRNLLPSLGGAGMALNIMLDLVNLGPYHEHGFYEDGTHDDVGYFGPDSQGNPRGVMGGECSDDYSISPWQYDDQIIRKAAQNVNNTGQFDPADYVLWSNNCQDYSSALRDEYKKLGGKVKYRPFGRRNAF